MRLLTRSIASVLLVSLGAVALSSCQSSGSGTGAISGNENGSEPANNSETNEYKKAIVRCYKTGGTRVVKIMGQLRCY